MTGKQHTTSQPILYFDGECNLCNSAIQFVIRHDRQKKFRFAPLQSAPGVALPTQVPTPKKNSYSTVVLFDNGRYYTQSAAALRTLRLMGGGWAVLYAAIIVPPFIRNWVYDLVSANRYKWFGRRKECMVPTPELKERFLS
jgi:predicted DCC family thiol-disulfide oxidoreductase YuxK